MVECHGAEYGLCRGVCLSRDVKERRGPWLRSVLFGSDVFRRFRSL